jgi:hypothetical protein
MPNKIIKNDVQKIAIDGASLDTDKTQWNKLKKTKWYHPHCYQFPDKIRQKWIEMAEKGYAFCDDNFNAQTYIPYFLKNEGIDKNGNEKTRLIFDFSHCEEGQISVNSIIKDKYATVDLKSLKHFIKFCDNNEKTKFMGKNDGESFFQQIPLSTEDWPIAVCIVDGHQWILNRLPWGVRPASRIAHRLSEAIAYITHKFIPKPQQPVYFSYIDDHLIRGYSYRICLIYHILYILICNLLYIKLKTSKTILSSNKIIALGFAIDLEKRTIEITTEKQQKYLKAIANFPI